MKHLINWIEIPATDMERARKFYELILGVELMEMELGLLRINTIVEL